MEKSEKQIKNRIGVVFDDGCFYDELSLAEMKGIISSAYTAWSEQDFKRYIDMFSLDPKQKINTLSKGMKMKYALALALSHNAELLIMDEPTSSLDPKMENELYENIVDICKNKTLLLISHRMSACRVCDRILTFSNGKIIENGSFDELMDLKGEFYKMYTAQKECY